jgi:hypothetical protein
MTFIKSSKLLARWKGPELRNDLLEFSGKEIPVLVLVEKVLIVFRKSVCLPYVRYA